MPIRNVAVIFDNLVRPDTTGIYCRRALGKLAQVEHFLPSERARIPAGFDLYVQIDDGLETHLPASLHPCAWWAIDTHLNFDWCLEKAREFDFVFAAQRDGAERLRQAGISSASWLPLACDPEFHRKHDVAKEFDICFVGHMFPGPRQELVELLQKHYPGMFVGQRFFEEMAQTYSASHLVFNRSIGNDVNMRVFEALACGSLLLTNDLRDNGQEELFRDGVHLATYANAEELLDKTGFYLKHEEMRERIAKGGRAEVYARHTYRSRMERLLTEVGTALSKEVVAKTVQPVFQEREKPAELDTRAGTSVQPCQEASACMRTSELSALLPSTARKVLDLTGHLKDLPKSQAEVVGPRGGCSPQWDGLVEKDAHGSFDAVVLGDALQEGVVEPALALRQARCWLRPQGQALARFANARHHGVVQALLDGNWSAHTYGQSSLSPSRFFTRREIEKLFFRARFNVLEIRGISDPEDRDAETKARAGEVKVGRLHIGGLSPEEAGEFYFGRYLVRAASLDTATDYGLTSIVILTHDQIAFTRMCVESIQRFTDEPYELIFVDNASSDGTLAYLNAVPGAKVIANPENRGFPAGANQGIQVATGRQVLLLNNDTVVTTGWLHRLLRALYSDPAIGLVGPCSNCVSGEQQVPVRYQDLHGLDGFAWDWGKAHDKERAETDRLIGFCLLIRREVIDQVGLLDERFGVGCFEDDDYCLRALKAGFRAVLARDSFVHHFGGRTFVGSGVPYDELLRTNQKLFQDKWSAAEHANGQKCENGAASPPQPAGYGLRRVHGGGLGLVRKGIHLSLCMIVRDNSHTIRACLESIKPWVDEMVVVDTGSKDDTPCIAEQLGARVFHFPWCDSFSAARNESLRHARGRWIFWMDSDDTIDVANGRKLRELAFRELDRSLLGVVMQVHCPGPEEDGQANVTVVDHVKLFRNRPQLRFEGRIHEQIIPAIRAAGGDIAWSDVFVVHSGYDHTPRGQEKKRQRDLHLLHLELKEQPEHPFTLFNLGMTYADINRHEEAVDFLKRCLRFSTDGDYLRKAYALLTYCNHRLGRMQEAWACCQQGLRLFPKDVELVFRKGVFLQESGRLKEAARTYQDVLQIEEGPHFKSVVRGLRGYMTRQNLACVYREMGDLEKAEEQWRLVVQEMPRYRAGFRGLGEVLLRQGKQPEVLAMVDRFLADKHLGSEALLLKSQVASLRGDTVEARRNLEKAVRDFPAERDVLEALCRFLFEHGRPVETEKALLKLLELEPEDGPTHHNLGTVSLRLGKFAEAVAAFRKSLQFRPDSVLTYLTLGHALRDSGQVEDAVAAWNEVLRLDPKNTEAAAMIRSYGHMGTQHSTADPYPNLTRTAKSKVRLKLGNRDVEASLALRGPVDRAILQEVWVRDVYGVGRLGKAPATVVDIGAHIGIFSLLAAETWPAARIIACEPDPENCALLRENLAGYQRVEFVAAAIVGEDVAEVNFHAVVNKAKHNSGGGSCVREEPWSLKTRVPAMSAVKLWRLKGLSGCDLLKLDCEGAEVSVLRALAAAGLLAKVRIVVGEWHAPEETDSARDRVKAELRSILAATHDVVFGPKRGGREGHFSATSRSES
jgi:FkbM family methyltransferase